MKAGAHPFTPAQPTPRPSTPAAESFTHVHAAIGHLADGSPVPAFLPAKREFPVDYTVTASHPVVRDGDVEQTECPHTIVGSVELPTAMSKREVYADLLAADPLCGPDWMPDELVAARFKDTEQSWLEAWQDDRADIEEVA